MLDPPIGKISFDFLTRFLVIGVVRYTSVSDLCHCVTPKVVGFLIRSFSRLRPREGMNEIRSATYLRPLWAERCGYDNIPILYSQAVV